MTRLNGLFGATTVSLLSLCASLAADTNLPYQTSPIHQGVASCASTVCHGRILPSEKSDLLQNEYITWSKYDRHSQAYQTLLSQESKTMARKLGFKNAHEAQVCLDCHSDNVPKSQRGERFLLSDGVGCEACHGGSEHWIKSHTQKKLHRTQFLQEGLYPTNEPVARSRLCLSCHMGNEDKQITHTIMGAGHPRLSFELDTFTAIAPAHFKDDKDYQERKPTFSSIQVWVQGAIASALAQVLQLQHKPYFTNRLIPELALFDCHACHHPMKEVRWQSQPLLGTIQPGSMRLNDGHLVMASTIASALNLPQAKKLKSAIRALHEASQKDYQMLSKHAEKTHGLLMLVQNHVINKTFSRAQKIRLFNGMLEAAKKSLFQDYIEAEQATMALELLAISLNQHKQLKPSLDKLYQLVSDEDRFNPDDYHRAVLTMSSFNSNL